MCHLTIYSLALNRKLAGVPNGKIFKIDLSLLEMISEHVIIDYWRSWEKYMNWTSFIEECISCKYKYMCVFCLTYDLFGPGTLCKYGITWIYYLKFIAVWKSPVLLLQPLQNWMHSTTTTTSHTLLPKKLLICNADLRIYNAENTI